MRNRQTGPAFVDPTDIVLTSPEANTVWMGDARRGVVTKVVGTQVFFRAIFDGKLDVRTIDKKEFCETYHHTPKVSEGTLREIHQHYAESAGATAEARASLSAYTTPSQKEPDMAAKPKTEAPKAEKPKATPKTPKPAEASRQGRKGAFEPSMKITVLVEGNPKRGTAAARFDLYAKNNTVEKYLAAGGQIADLRWDSKQNFIKVE